MLGKKTIMNGMKYTNSFNVAKNRNNM